MARERDCHCRPYTGFALDREGAIWAATTRGLFRFTNSRWEKIGAEWGFFAELRAALFVDKQGKLWVNGNTDLYCLSPGAHVFQMRKIPHDWIMKSNSGRDALDVGERREYERSTAHWRSFTTDPRQRLGPGPFRLWWIGRASFGCRPNVAEGLRRVANPERLPNALIDVGQQPDPEIYSQRRLTGDHVSSALEDLRAMSGSRPAVDWIAFEERM